jgi:uncharacterized protein (TIGR03435 family)
MPELDDHRLLAEFVRGRSEIAFTELVKRYAGLVHSTAFRFCDNPHHAEEITQAVFVILAHKAETLSPRVVVSGWLYQTARLTAANFVKGEMRRRRREQEAVMQSNLLETDSSDWGKIAPLLDDAMGTLGETDRNAVLLRYFENRTSSEIGVALRMTEETARKRVNRALEKLRHIFVKRGVTVSSAALSGAISTNSVQPISAFMVKSISTVAAAKGATASTSTLTLINGALKIMAWTKAKTAAVAVTAVILATGTTTVIVKEIRGHRPYTWQVQNADTGILNRVPPQVKIVPTIFSPTDRGFNMSDNKMLGMGQTINSLLGAAYQISRYRIVFSAQPPAGNYDFIANLPDGNNTALQREIERQFNLTARKETRETDVLVLTRKYRNAPGLKPNPGKSSNVNNDYGAGRWRGSNLTSQNIAGRLERFFKIPVVDHAGLTGRFNVDLKWDEQFEGQSPDAFKEALLDQLGLELVPTNMPVEMLVVEKAKD